MTHTIWGAVLNVSYFNAVLFSFGRAGVVVPPEGCSLKHREKKYDKKNGDPLTSAEPERFAVERGKLRTLVS